ncbi:ATP-dependent DNA helicase [Trichonephila clavipes]|nr:ATP-dependent DNA helicase [Trichonephila clavipes]
MSEVLRKCKIIIWDECTMTHKRSLEALDRTPKDIKNNTKLFGGALLLLSGDFRQTLPVIPCATYADEINACLKESYLWRSISKLCLTINMHVHLQNDLLASRFSEQLLDIGYDLRHNYTDNAWLHERAILAAKNLDVDAINLKIQQSLPGNEISFKSIDTVVDPDEVVNYPVGLLNSLDLPGMPPHNLRLKIRSPKILHRNLNAPKLCNGTRLVIKNHGQHS